MPDRYGNPDETSAGDDLTAIALTVGCRHCHAPIGKPCTNSTLPDRPPTRIPHPCRMADAEEVPF